MISSYKSRISDGSGPVEHVSNQSRDAENNSQLGSEIIAQIKKMAVAQPAVVVAAGLAVGVVTGLILKRK